MTHIRNTEIFDTVAIYKRFESCYNVSSSGELARVLDAARQTTNDWKNGRSKVPWWRLKELTDMQGIGWDWLLTGKGPKHHAGNARGETVDFDTEGINNRYLSLFPPDLSQAELARLHMVTQVTMHKWQRKDEQVPWKKLHEATQKFKVTWEWLIEGRDPTQD